MSLNELLLVVAAILLVMLAVSARRTEQRAKRAEQAYRSTLQSIEVAHAIPTHEILKVVSDVNVEEFIREEIAVALARQIAPRLNIIRTPRGAAYSEHFAARIWVSGLVPSTEDRVAETATAALAKAAKR